VRDGSANGIDAAVRLDVIGRNVTGADLREIRGVRGIVSAHDDHQVRLVPHQLEDGVLAILCRRTDRIEAPEPLGKLLLSPPVQNRFADDARDLERLRRQHRGLVGNPDPLQVHLRIEAVRSLARELLADRVGIDVAADVLTYELDLFHVAHDQEAASFVPQNL